MGIGSAIFMLIVVVVAYVLVHTAARKTREREAFEKLNTQPNLLIPLALLQRDNPDLPAAPPSTEVYEVWEVWFQQAIGVVATGTRRSRDEALKLCDQLLRCQLQFLTYINNRSNIQLANLEYEAKRQELLVRIEQSKAALATLKKPGDDSRPRYIDV